MAYFPPQPVIHCFDNFRVARAPAYVPERARRISISVGLGFLEERVRGQYHPGLQNRTESRGSYKGLLTG